MLQADKTWSKPSQSAWAFGQLLESGLSFQDVLERIEKPSWARIYERLLELSPEQLVKLDELCPRTVDLTLEIIEYVRGR